MHANAKVIPPQGVYLSTILFNLLTLQVDIQDKRIFYQTRSAIFVQSDYHSAIPSLFHFEMFHVKHFFVQYYLAILLNRFYFAILLGFLLFILLLT